MSRTALATGTASPSLRVPPVHRQVEHVMGMPVSLALRGRHAGDRRSMVAWQDAVGMLREPTGCSAPTDLAPRCPGSDAARPPSGTTHPRSRRC